jgi:hypothetical protein
MPAIELPDPPLSDGAFVLRWFESSDVPALVVGCQDPLISRFTLVPARTARTTRAATRSSPGCADC